MAIRPFLRDPSVRALLDADGAVGVPDLAIQRVARAWLAKCFVFPWSGPPFDMELLARMRNYEVVYQDGFPDELSGMIDPKQRRIIVNSRLPARRRRFTIAHEIAHTFFPDFGKRKEHEIGQNTYEFAEQSPVEQLCQIAAAELLMPLESFQAALPNTIARAEGIQRLADLFDASFEAVARRWISLSPPTSVLIHARPAADGALVVGTSIRGGGFVPPVARGTLIPGHTLPARVWSRPKQLGSPADVENAGEDWRGFAGIHRCFVEAVPLPLAWDTPMSVLCLVHRSDRRRSSF